MKVLVVLGVWAGLSLPALGQNLTVTSVSPPMHTAAPYDTDVVIDFDRPLDRGSVTSAPNHVHVFGEATGTKSGTLAFENGDTRLRFTPDQPFSAGETVRVTLAERLQGTDGKNLRLAGYTYEFWIQTAPASLDFAPVDGMSMRQSPTEAVRVYGGLGADFDKDGFLDLALINEDSNDFRVLLNRDDGTGHFHDLEATPLPLGLHPSPVVSADFDVDGHTDVVASNTEDTTVTVLFGNGDGTFQTPMNLTADLIPRGLGVIEANGDGFIDIVTANYTDTTGDVALLLNDGMGGFAPPILFDAGITHEFALDTADLDNDGIQDIVVAGRESQSIVTLIANGDGTFHQQSVQSTGGMTWRILCGDVDGDGDMDVTTANGLSANGAVLFNDGLGNLSPPVVQVSAGFTTDTDLGDLDGDGDLDWMLSNFSGLTWKIFLNDGHGAFTFHSEFHAIQRPAGVVMMDIDNDHDLDLALMDEIADVVTFMENQPPNVQLFCFGDGTGTPCPCGNSGDPGHGCNNVQDTGGVNVTTGAFQSQGPGQGIAQLVATGFSPSTSPVIVPIRSPSVQNGGLGVPLADGLICLGSPVVRLKLQTAQNGTASIVLRHQAGPGTFHYQLFYRNQGNFCSPGQFNSTNAVTLVWP
jgi:FG-GAP-like repeat/Bacterial Ig-like domain